MTKKTRGGGKKVKKHLQMKKVVLEAGYYEVFVV